MTCEYEIQRFTPNINISITSTDALSLQVSLDDNNKVKVTSSIDVDDFGGLETFNYGTKISDIISRWVELFENSSNCREDGWYEFDVIFDAAGAPLIDNITVLDTSAMAILNENKYICAKYHSSSPEDSKRVIFYTWGGNETTGHYVEYVYNSNYILKSVSYEYLKIDPDNIPGNGDEIDELKEKNDRETREIYYEYRPELPASMPVLPRSQTGDFSAVYVQSFFGGFSAANIALPKREEL